MRYGCRAPSARVRFGSIASVWLSVDDFRFSRKRTPSRTVGMSQKCHEQTWQMLLLRRIGFARLTPTQATDPHAGRARLLRYLRRARCEPLLWRVSVARQRHFRAKQ